MLISKLLETHPCYCKPLIEDNQAIASGGAMFRQRTTRFLPKRPMENDATYQARVNESDFKPYINVIINYYTTNLFSSKIDYRYNSTESLPTWFDQFSKDADGNGKDLISIFKVALTNSLVHGRTWLAIKLPDSYGTSQTAKQAEANQEYNFTVKVLPNSQVLDWEESEDGQLLWVNHYEQSSPRTTFTDSRSTTLHRWTVYTTETVTVYEAITLKDEELDPTVSLTPVIEIKHNSGRVPVVSMAVPDFMCVTNILKQPQIEHFRLSSALSWSLKNSAYPLPIFSTENPAEFSPTFGPSSYMVIGKDDKAEYLEASGASSSSLEQAIKTQKDEIFRLAGSMVLAADVSASSMRASAESKELDDRNSKQILSDYGVIVTEAYQDLLNLVSFFRGEQELWTVSGLNTFETNNVNMLLPLLESMSKLNYLDSNAFRVELFKNVALTALPEITEEIRNKIAQEITDSEASFSVEEQIHRLTNRMR